MLRMKPYFGQNLPEISCKLCTNINGFNILIILCQKQLLWFTDLGFKFSGLRLKKSFPHCYEIENEWISTARIAFSL